MFLDPFGCAADPSTSLENLLEIPDISSRMIGSEVAKIGAVLHLPQMSDDPYVIQSQKVPRGDLHDLQRIEILGFRLGQDSLEPSPHGFVAVGGHGPCTGCRHDKEEVPSRFGQPTLYLGSVHTSQDLPCAILL